MDPLFIYESGKDRVDSNLLNVQTVAIQNLLKVSWKTREFGLVASNDMTKKQLA